MTKHRRAKKQLQIKVVIDTLCYTLLVPFRCILHKQQMTDTGQTDTGDAGARRTQYAARIFSRCARYRRITSAANDVNNFALFTATTDVLA